MKNEDNKNNKIVAVLYYCTSLCFYIVAIIIFARGSISTGIVFLCLGSTFLCLGSVYLNKDKEDKDNK